MKVSYTYNASDFVRLNIKIQEQYFLNQKTLRRLQMRIPILSFFVVAWVWLVAVGSTNSDLWAAIASLIILMLNLYYLLSLKKNLVQGWTKLFEKIYKQPQWAYLKKGVTIELKKDGLHIRHEDYEARFNWDIVKWEQEDKYLFLFTLGNSSYIIPKRVFKKKADQTKFLEKLKKFSPSQTSQ
jgi:hypothetical protein